VRLADERPLLLFRAHNVRLTGRMDWENQLSPTLSNELPHAGLFSHPRFLLCLIPFPFLLSFLAFCYKQFCSGWRLPPFFKQCFKYLSKKQDKSLFVFFFFFFDWLMPSEIVPNKVIPYKIPAELRDRVGYIVGMKNLTQYLPFQEAFHSHTERSRFQVATTGR